MSDLSPYALGLSDGATTTVGTTLNYDGFGRPDGGIASDSGTYESTTATADVLAAGDTITVDGVVLIVTGMTEYLVTVLMTTGRHRIRPCRL